MRTSPEKRNPSGSEKHSGATKIKAFLAAVALGFNGLFGGCSGAQEGVNTPPSDGTSVEVVVPGDKASAEASQTITQESPSPTKLQTPEATADTEQKATASPTPEVAESATPDIERTPLRDWKGLEMLDNLPEDRGESINKIREFIMLNDPECDLTAERIAASTTWGNFTDTGEQLMKALNVVGSLYSDYTVKGNQKKADLLIDGLTSYHSPEANKELKSFIHNTFFEAEFMDQCRPEVCNQRFSGAEITQETDTLVVVPTDIGDPQQGYTILVKLRPGDKSLVTPPSPHFEPTLKISLNVGGVITGFELVE